MGRRVLRNDVVDAAVRQWLMERNTNLRAQGRLEAIVHERVLRDFLQFGRLPRSSSVVWDGSFRALLRSGLSTHRVEYSDAIVAYLEDDVVRSMSVGQKRNWIAALNSLGCFRAAAILRTALISEVARELLIRLDMASDLDAVMIAAAIQVLPRLGLVTRARLREVCSMPWSGRRQGTSLLQLAMALGERATASTIANQLIDGADTLRSLNECDSVYISGPLHRDLPPETGVATWRDTAQVVFKENSRLWSRLGPPQARLTVNYVNNHALPTLKDFIPERDQIESSRKFILRLRSRHPQVPVTIRDCVSRVAIKPTHVTGSPTLALYAVLEVVAVARVPVSIDGFNFYLSHTTHPVDHGFRDPRNMQGDGDRISGQAVRRFAYIHDPLGFKNALELLVANDLVKVSQAMAEEISQADSTMAHRLETLHGHR